MMSLEQIHELSRRAALASRRAGVTLQDLWPEDIELARQDPQALAQFIPFIGDRCPKGWHRVRLSASEPGVYMGDNKGFGAYFVDATGVGGPTEPALTIGGFVRALEPGFAYAIVEAGQFQVKIGKFAKSKAKKAKAPVVEPTSYPTEVFA